MFFCRLASGTEVAAAITDNRALQGNAADRAQLTAEEVSDPELKVGDSLLTAGAIVGIYTGPLVLNRIREHLSDALM